MTDVDSNTTNRVQLTYFVAYEILTVGGENRRGTSQVLTGPDATGADYTDFEDIRKILAVKHGVEVNVILVLGVSLETGR